MSPREERPEVPDTEPPPPGDETERIPESVFDEVREALRKTAGRKSGKDSAREMRAAVAKMDEALEHLVESERGGQR